MYTYKTTKIVATRCVAEAQRIRSFTTMRYINLRFTYLLTYLLTYSKYTRNASSVGAPTRTPMGEQAEGKGAGGEQKGR